MWKNCNYSGSTLFSLIHLFINKNQDSMFHVTRNKEKAKKKKKADT